MHRCRKRQETGRDDVDLSDLLLRFNVSMETCQETLAMYQGAYGPDGGLFEARRGSHG